MAKNYSGSDLSAASKSQLKSWIRDIKKVLTARGCTDCDFSYGFHFLSGFFTAPSGQMYYIGSNDTRDGNLNMYYRTAKHYKDYTGGHNCKLYSISDLKDVKFN